MRKSGNLHTVNVFVAHWFFRHSGQYLLNSGKEMQPIQFHKQNKSNIWNSESKMLFLNYHGFASSSVSLCENAEMQSSSNLSLSFTRGSDIVEC